MNVLDSKVNSKHLAANSVEVLWVVLFFIPKISAIKRKMALHFWCWPKRPGFWQWTPAQFSVKPLKFPAPQGTAITSLVPRTAFKRYFCTHHFLHWVSFERALVFKCFAVSTQTHVMTFTLLFSGHRSLTAAVPPCLATPAPWRFAEIEYVKPQFTQFSGKN